MKLLLVAIVGIISSVVISTGATHVQCPVCGYGAVCQNNKCVCPSSYYGDPSFSCYNPSKWLHCRLKCDPELQTFDLQNASISLISANTFSNVETTVPPVYRLHQGGKCHLKLQDYPTRFKGKFFIGGIRFHFKLFFSPTKFIVIWGLIKTYVFKDPHGNIVFVWEIYFWSSKLRKYVLFSKMTNKGTGNSCTRKASYGCSIYFYVSTSNFLVATFSPCEQTFGIRPYNPFGSQNNVPGIWVQVPHKAKFVGLPHALCNQPEHGLNIDELVKKLQFETRRQLMTYISWSQFGNPINYPGAPAKLKDLRTAVRVCPKPRAAIFFRRAELLYENAFLVRCLGKNRLEALIDVILKLLKSFCYRNVYSRPLCAKAVLDVKTRCPDYVHRPKVKQFLWTICNYCYY